MTLKTKFAFVLGTWFGSGKAPFASGTFGSLAALPFGWAIMYYFGTIGLAAAAVVIYFIGVWAAKIIMDELKIEDPGLIVIDEVVGQWIACLVAPMTIVGYATAFVFFRIFDISKPWPACWAGTKLHNATGVMLDDVFAGMYAAIFVALLTHFAPTLMAII